MLNDEVRGAAFFADGSIALTGEFRGNTAFEGQMAPLSFTSAAMRSFFLARYQRTDGALAWARTTTSLSLGYHVRSGPGGAILVTGATDGLAVFGGGEPTETALVAPEETSSPAISPRGALTACIGWARGLTSSTWSSHRAAPSSR